MDTELRKEYLAEFSALRAEIRSHLGFRRQYIIFTTLIFGTIISLGSQSATPTTIYLLYPVLAVFLAIGWGKHDKGIHRIGSFIRNNIEDKLEGINWQTTLYNRLASKNPAFRPARLTATGIFLGSQTLAITLALPLLTYNYTEITLLAFDTLAFIFTYVALRQANKTLKTPKKYNFLTPSNP